MNKKRVGIIGLGLMGTALTERLLDAEYAVWVHNRTREKADPLLARGARWADNPLAECDRVLISLYTTDTVEEVLGQLGEALRPGQILIDTTTGEPEQTTRLGARLAERGVHYLDAPISGSSQQTRDGNVTTIVGGPRETFDACGDLFDCWSAKTIYAGPCGSGSKMKLVSNLVLGLNRAALAEGLVFAETLGLDTEAALEVLMGSMSYSRIMDTKGNKMIQGDFRTQARLAQHLKDIQLIVAAATRAGQGLPLSIVHQQLLEAAVSAGWGDEDNSAIIQTIRQCKGPLPHSADSSRTGEAR
jgi:3-hydroxyisobutyrate dehydrogenase-like beta-hydroxyacid dehydrogenase